MSQAEVGEARSAGLSTGDVHRVCAFQSLRGLTHVTHTGGISCCLLLFATLASDLRVPEIDANAILLHPSEFDTSTHLLNPQA